MSGEAGRRRLLPTTADAIDAGAVLGFTLIALWAYRSSYGGVAFMVVGAVGGLLAIVLVHVAARLRWPWFVTAAAGVMVYAVAASVLALRHRCLAGVVPTPDSLLDALSSAASTWKELLTTSPPVGATGDLMVLPVFVGFATAFLIQAVARGMRCVALALVPPLVALALGIAVGTDRAVSVVLHGAVLIVAMVAWFAWREQRRRPILEGLGADRRRVVAAVGVLAVAAVAGYAIAPSLPGAAAASEREIWRQTVVPPFDPRDYPSPLAGYRDYVKLGYDARGERADAAVMFTIEGLPAGIPVRLATMDAYDGLVWQVSGGDPDNPSLRDSGSFERIGASLPADFAGETAEVTVTIREYSDVWVPDVGEVLSLTFTGSEGGPARDRELATSFRYNRATDTAATPVRLRAGDRYVMKVRLPHLLDDISGHQVMVDVTPIGQARSVSEITQAIGTPDLLLISDTAERLDRVRDLMVATGAYSDGDIAAGHIRAKAGHSAYRLVEFAGRFPREPFIGNAEQYAAAYALLFRDLDHLPTRVVMGFRPTEPSLDAPVDVVQTDIDAWVEVPVDGLGWVAIHPTPPRDQIASATTSPQQPEPDYRTQNPPPPPLVDPEFEQPATASGDAKPLDEEPEVNEDRDEGGDPGQNPIASAISSRYVVTGAIVLSPFLAMLAGGLTVIAVKTWRRRRRRSRGAAHQRIANGWLEVTDLATDLGRAVPPTTTRREAAAFVGSGAATALAERTDATVWGGSALSDAEVEAYWAELTATLGAMRAELGRWARLRAAMSPRSLRRSGVRTGRER